MVEDDTISSRKLPNTGNEMTLLGIMAVLIVGSIIFHFKYKKLKGIK